MGFPCRRRFAGDDYIQFEGFSVDRAAYRQVAVLAPMWKGEGATLPSEEQWPRVAHGARKREYPWRDASPDESVVNFDARVFEPTPVGLCPARVP